MIGSDGAAILLLQQQRCEIDLLGGYQADP